MAQATPDTLITMALDRAPGGRNNAGLWLAQQLHWNGYPEPEAEAVMRQYAAACGDSTYTEREALATLKAEYRRPAKEPWTGGASTNGGTRRADRARRAFPTAPPKPRDPNPESVELYRHELRNVKPLPATPGAVYLESRGIPVDLARSARVKYAPSWGKIGAAVVFPIRNADGEAVAAAGRAIHGTGKQTFGPLSFGVFYTPGALESDPVAITEAPIDALSLALAGLPALALCGIGNPALWLVKHLGMRAVHTPAGFGRTVFLAFDNDPAGDTAAARIGANLPLVRTVRLRPQGKDWNADLTTDGPEPLRDYLTDAGVFADPTQNTPGSVNASESNPVATVATSSGELVPESNPTTPSFPTGSCKPDTRARDTSPTETPAALADRIRAALAGRSLPIAITRGVTIGDPELYAEAEARAALHYSPSICRPARERLEVLGIEI